MSDALRRLIHDAFSDTRPPRRPVTGHRCEECDEVDRLLGGRTWAEAAADFPPYCADTFPLLTEEAQAYYLPAYMLVAVERPGGIQGVALESALEDGRLQPRRFTAAQRAAVVAWAAEHWRETEGEEPPRWLVDAWRSSAA